jgi:conjugative transfer signal peptidase TraF
MFGKIWLMCPLSSCRRFYIFVIMAAGLIGLCFEPVDERAWIAFNGSASAPIGFYWLRDGRPRLGDLVFVKLPQDLESWVVDRTYLPTAMPMLKRVSGITGDQFCRFGGLVFVNGFVVATALRRDSMARPLPVWNGCVGVPENAVVLLMPQQPKSFDSRYFGPISRDQILKIATPMWTWTDVQGGAGIEICERRSPTGGPG